MIVSNLGIDYIKGWEKFRNKAYLDQAKIWTIGYGTIRYFDGSPIGSGDVISISRATSYLIAECEGIVMKLNIMLKHEWGQNEFDAMVSLAYNIGTQGFRSSTLLRRLNTDDEIFENYFTRWNKVTIDGKLVPSRGLTRRRKCEWKLFSEGDYTGNS